MTERGKRWRRLPRRSLTLLLRGPPGHFHISLRLIHGSASHHPNICCRKKKKNSRNIAGIFFPSNVIFTIFRICPLVPLFSHLLKVGDDMKVRLKLEYRDEEISGTWIVPPPLKAEGSAGIEGGSRRNS